MTRAGELANDLAHQLEIVEAERDELKLLLDEAQAVIDAVRKVRERIAEAERAHYRLWAEDDDETSRLQALACRDALALLDGIDGL